VILLSQYWTEKHFGEPAAFGYEQNGIVDTSEAVIEARKKGIEVINVFSIAVLDRKTFMTSIPFFLASMTASLVSTMPFCSLSSKQEKKG
jgi:hypothetical protein